MNTKAASENKQTSSDDTIKRSYRILECLKAIKTSRWLIALVIILFLTLMIIGISKILNHGPEAGGQVYKAICFGMIMVWVCIFICYFIWAVYFYNLNYGFSQKVWNKIEAAKENRSNGFDYNQADIDQEPKDNPYKNETFGLPAGTVRGMIAFTLLFGSIAMLIVSFGMKNEIQANGFFIDQFDFFKTAFLMMIAFYFGNHSLKYLKPIPNEKPEDLVPPKPPEPNPEKPNIEDPVVEEGEKTPITETDSEEAKG